jgi:hypothetical protein
MDRRIDYLTALLIDAVLNGWAAHGTSHAARALYDMDIPLGTAVRVLTRPRKRRCYDLGEPVEEP